MKTKKDTSLKILNPSIAVSGKPLLRNLGRLCMAPLINQAGAIAIGQITVYENGEIELGELGEAPRHPFAVKTRMQIAAYKSKTVTHYQPD